MKKRSDGRYVKVMKYKRSDGTEYTKWFYDASESGLFKQISAYEIEQEAGRTFVAVAADWREEHYQNITYNTQRGYDKSYKRAVEHFGKFYIKQITPANVKAYISKFTIQNYSSKTITHHLSVLKLIFTKAVIDGDIPQSPAEHIKTPSRLKKHKRQPPTPEEVNIIKNSLDKTFGLFAYFILYTGLRKSEALALQYKDIDYEKRLITVDKAWYEKNNKPHIKMPKTEAGKRTVPLLDPIIKMLPKGEPDEYIFGFPEGKQYVTLWNKYRQETGIKCGVHQIRHEYITMLYDAGINDFDAMHIVGHADITTMRNIYTHIRESRHEQITDILNEKLTII